VTRGELGLEDREVNDLNLKEPPMTSITSAAISPLRRRMIEDMSVRKFGEKTQHDYLRQVEIFAKFLGRSPDTATAEDLRRYQVHQTESGVQAPSMNSSAVALRFFFTVTLGRANLAAQLTRVHYPRRLPRVLSPDEVARLIEAAPGPGSSTRRRSALPTVPDCARPKWSP
jgi:integrase/recombinase XerD